MSLTLAGVSLPLGYSLILLGLAALAVMVRLVRIAAQ